MNNLFRKPTSWIPTTCLLIATASFADENLSGEEALEIEEVLVTARKRSESMLEIPESVTALSGELVSRRNIKGLNKLGRAVPNVNLAMRTDSYPNVSIRGVGAFGLTQGVGF